MKIAILIVVALLGGCLDHQDTLNPVWSGAKTQADLDAWATDVIDAVASWQRVLGDDCEFPFHVGTTGMPVELVGAAEWRWPGTVGLYEHHEVKISGERPHAAESTYILAHELGHVAGLEHTEDFGSVMYSSSDWRAARAPTAIDGAALRLKLGCD